MANKAVELNIVFKENVIATEKDVDFNALINETIETLKDKLQNARIQIMQAKTSQVDGIPTLSEKGVEVGIKITF